MKRSRNTTIAAVLLAAASLYSIIFAIPLLSRGADALNAAVDSPPFFIVAGSVVFGVLGLVAAYGLWRNQRWGKILAIVVCAINMLSALPGIFFAPTPALFVSASVGVGVSILIIVLALWPTPGAAVAQS
jgi:uncharacterized membrane protein (DUF2068 family)